MRLLGAVAAATLLISALWALLEARLYSQPSGVYVELWNEHWRPALGLGAPLVLGSFALNAVLASFVREARYRAWAASVLPWLVVAGVALLHLNRRYLPERFSSTSLIGNGLFALFAIAVLLWLVRIVSDPRASARGEKARGSIGSVASIGASALLLALAGKGAFAASTPHVFVFLVDVLRADHLGCYGYERPTSPNIDRFAQDAVLFEDAMAQSSYTKTSVASLFTGRFPHRHGVYRGDLTDTANRITSDTLARSYHTLAEYMTRAGYMTLGLVHNGNLRPYMGFDQGFAFYDNDPGYIPVMAESFRDLRETWAGRRPLFSYVHVLDLHAPYDPPDDLRDRFGRVGHRFDGYDHTLWTEFMTALRRGNQELSADDVTDLEALYDAELLYVDEWIGSMLDGLREAGLYDDSLIVFLADHGDGFWEHDFISHSTVLYQEVVHVPLIVKLPGSKNAGTRVQGAVGLVDVLPTLLDFVGTDVVEEVDGRSLLDVLHDPGSSPLEPWDYVSEYRTLAAVRSGRWKLLLDHRSASDKRKLFDIQNDPGESNNLHDAEPEVAQRLGELLNSIPRKRAQLPQNEQAVLDEKTIAELKALGYL